MSEPPTEPLTEPPREPPTEPVPPERRRILWKLFLAFCVFSLIGFSLLGWFVTTDSFQQRVRRRVVASIEKITAFDAIFAMAVFYWLLVEAVSRVGSRVELRVTAYLAQEGARAWARP